MTSPILELKQYPRQAQSVLAAYRKEFGLAPTAYTLYGYAAMQSVLAAIRAVHAKSTAARYRLDVVAAYFHLGVRNSVIGREANFILRARGITTIALGGFLTNCCVESTMRSGYEKGYEVVGSAGQLIELHSFSGH